MSTASKINVEVSYTSEFHPLTSGHRKALNALKDYKLISLSEDPTLNFVAPPEGIQSARPPAHPSLGRDKVFEFPERFISRIHLENLSHVHYSDGTWKSDTSQWDCTSKLAIVYSGIQLSPTHFHFVVHDFLLNEQNEQGFDAHDNYKHDMEYYLNNSKYYRDIVTYNYKQNK